MCDLWSPAARIASLATVAASLLFNGVSTLRAQDAPPAPLPAAPAPAQPTATEPVTAQKEADKQLQQRLVGVVPNYFVVYTPHPVPLHPTQKFQLALRSAIDPVTLVGAGLAGGWGQWQNDPPNFPQGAAGYGMRVGASYGATIAGTITGRAIFPSLLKQDPRYFYRGTGSFKSRFYYALSQSFICMGDNGRWQVNVSETMGAVADATATEFKYSPNDRFGVGRMAENFLITKASYAGRNLFDEFLSLRLTYPWKHRVAKP